MRVVQVHDDTLGIEGGRDHALTAEDALASECRVQRIQVTHAVEQRQDGCFRTHGRRHATDHVIQVVSLAAQHDEVEVGAQILRLDGGRIVHGDVAERTPDVQTGAPELLRAARAHEKGHVLACLQQPAAKIAADRSGADDQYSHDRGPLRLKP